MIDDYDRFRGCMEIRLSSLKSVSIGTALVAALAGVEQRTVRRWCESGKLVAHQDAKSKIWYISRRDWEKKRKVFVKKIF